jgi:hypothetical protein
MVGFNYCLLEAYAIKIVIFRAEGRRQRAKISKKEKERRNKGGR